MSIDLSTAVRLSYTEHCVHAWLAAVVQFVKYYEHVYSFNFAMFASGFRHKNVADVEKS